MPRMTRPGYQRLVPEHSVGRYLEGGWEVADGSTRPAGDDLKAVWVEYAVSQGYDPDEGLTKADLIERYG